MKLAFIVVTALMSMNAHAALSGYYDSAKKIVAATSSMEVGNNLRQAPIKKVEVKGLKVVIETENCALGVTLRALLPKGMGATQYEVARVTQAQCN